MLKRYFVTPSSHELPEVPVVEARGARPGPALTLFAGVHGCEYAPMAALRSFMRSLDTGLLSGTVRAVLMANPTAFRERTPFVTPEDGKNLNRCFPGTRNGTHSERLAEFLFSRFVRGSDALIDLHAGDLVEALSPFTLHDASPVADRTRELAIAYGMPLAIRQQRAGAAVSGSTCGAAAADGIPAFIAEAGGCGLVTTEAVAAHTAGLFRVLVHLGMLRPLEPVPAAPRVRHMNRFVWLRSPVRGWWEPAVGPGSEVAAGSRLGAVLDPFGEELAEITAPEDGVLVFLTSSPAVGADALLLALAGGEEVPREAA
ncbi:succinylglutamate desuccinylase/aspartoacylase family protein [Streptomyces tibetensis]|uniref:succinylglutamate desuccinylase/aspartoacylase family protein n=1 Tax=Streptomyces tibetensis TaxID=2382123 RepID=UPI0033D43BFB